MTTGHVAHPEAHIDIDGFALRLDRSYDPDTHHWVQVIDGRRLRIGLDALTADSYGALAELIITPTGTRIARGEAFGSLEAAKYVGPMLTPVSGAITAVNPAVLDNPDLVLRAPYDDGWLIELEATNLDEEQDLLLSDGLACSWYRQCVLDARLNGLVAE